MYKVSHMDWLDSRDLSIAMAKVITKSNKKWQTIALLYPMINLPKAIALKSHRQSIWDTLYLIAYLATTMTSPLSAKVLKGFRDKYIERGEVIILLLESNSYLHFARLMLEAFPSKAEFSERCQPLELASSRTITTS